MKISFRKSFLRDLKKVKDKEVLATVQAAIEQAEKAASPLAIVDLKKLSGADNCYRIIESES